jgi:hypothetical protein
MFVSKKKEDVLHLPPDEALRKLGTKLGEDGQ